MKKIFVLLLAMLLLLASASAEVPFSIVSPDGAPALAVSALKENVETIKAATIVTALQNGSADFVIAPVNAGAKLFKAGKSTYRLAAVVTWGNLVFASQIEGFTPEMMNGKVVTLFGQDTINAAVALYILREKGIVPSEIEYLGDAQTTQMKLIDEKDAIVMTAEPAVTAAKMKNDAVVSYSLSDLYKEITGTDGFVQAGLFVRAQTIEEHPEEIKQWLETIREAVERCEDTAQHAAVAEDAVAMGIIQNSRIAEMAIPGCHIHYAAASEVRKEIEAIAAIDLSQFGGDLPEDDFYYAE